MLTKEKERADREIGVPENPRTDLKVGHYKCWGTLTRELVVHH
jgi:hypothetical protein